MINTAGDLILKKEKACLNVYLGDLKDPWLHFCQTLHQKPGTVLKQFIQTQLNGETGKIFQQTSESPDDTKKHRFEVLLTPTEKAAVELRSSQEGCSQRRWVIHTIRAVLTKQAQFSLPEIEALGASNYQLLAIGRNLNQLVKAYHEGHRPSNVVPLIEKLQQAIDHHTKKVSDALRASTERWDTE